ncbi:hypothetical protein CTI12_AA429940 [Artemisia annua]|uniref:Acyl-[acyl-carrier-protein] hydrolase n=1 Tax=Artemisia annua TaxID=35608 RepID=A0A2U1M1L9_ARTAN|nr:hypothetical protein CTI12_AA429940 [Artemisia annua]
MVFLCNFASLIISFYMKEVSSNHTLDVGFSTDGFGTTDNMRKLHLIWVATRMHIEVYRYPARSDVIEFETWIQCDGKIGIRCDWILKDYVNGEEVSSNHTLDVGFSTDGFGTTDNMRKLHLIWVATRMHIEVYRYPARYICWKFIRITFTW